MELCLIVVLVVVLRVHTNVFYPTQMQSTTRRVRRLGAGRNCGTIIAGQLHRSRHHECDLISNASRGLFVHENRKGGSVSCLVLA